MNKNECVDIEKTTFLINERDVVVKNAESNVIFVLTVTCEPLPFIDTFGFNTKLLSEKAPPSKDMQKGLLADAVVI